MTKVEQLVIHMLTERHPNFPYAEKDVWDIVPAARGLTVVMLDGMVFPLRCSDGTAKELLHGWSVQAAEG